MQCSNHRDATSPCSPERAYGSKASRWAVSAHSTGGRDFSMRFPLTLLPLSPFANLTSSPEGELVAGSGMPVRASCWRMKAAGHCLFPLRLALSPPRSVWLCARLCRCEKGIPVVHHGVHSASPLGMCGRSFCLGRTKHRERPNSWNLRVRHAFRQENVGAANQHLFHLFSFGSIVQEKFPLRVRRTSYRAVSGEVQTTSRFRKCLDN